MPEYLEYRCCMCPNADDNPKLVVCPAIHGKQYEAPCRFVKSYTDERGWRYRVMGTLGGGYRARYQKPEKCGEDGWKSVK